MVSFYFKFDAFLAPWTGYFYLPTQIKGKYTYFKKSYFFLGYFLQRGVRFSHTKKKRHFTAL